MKNTEVGIRFAIQVIVMPRKPRIFFKNSIHHVFFRGNQKQRVFQQDSDYAEYISRLEEVSTQEAITVHAFSILPNHGHLILYQETENPISHMMQRLQGGFTQYWNSKYEKVGHVFQGRYKSILCKEESYLLELIRYIHLNAPRGGLVDTPEEYRWCSHKDYISPKTNKFICTKMISSYFDSPKTFDDFVKAGLKDNKNFDEICLSIETVIKKGLCHPLPTLSTIFHNIINEPRINANQLHNSAVYERLIKRFIKASRKHGFSTRDIIRFLNISRSTLRRIMNLLGSDPEWSTVDIRGDWVVEEGERGREDINCPKKLR